MKPVLNPRLTLRDRTLLSAIRDRLPLYRERIAARISAGEAPGLLNEADDIVVLLSLVDWLDTGDPLLADVAIESAG